MTRLIRIGYDLYALFRTSRIGRVVILSIAAGIGLAFLMSLPSMISAYKTVAAYMAPGSAPSLVGKPDTGQKKPEWRYAWNMRSSWHSGRKALASAKPVWAKEAEIYTRYNGCKPLKNPGCLGVRILYAPAEQILFPTMNIIQKLFPSYLGDGGKVGQIIGHVAFREIDDLLRFEITPFAYPAVNRVGYSATYDLDYKPPTRQHIRQTLEAHAGDGYVIFCHYKHPKHAVTKREQYWHEKLPGWAQPDTWKRDYRDSPFLKFGRPVSACPMTRGQEEGPLTPWDKLPKPEVNFSEYYMKTGQFLGLSILAATRTDWARGVYIFRADGVKIAVHHETESSYEIPTKEQIMATFPDFFQTNEYFLKDGMESIVGHPRFKWIGPREEHLAYYRYFPAQGVVACFYKDDHGAWPKYFWFQKKPAQFDKKAFEKKYRLGEIQGAVTACPITWPTTDFGIQHRKQ